MIGVKGGTQTWSNSVQRADFKDEKINTISATDKAANFQDEAIGDTLNKLTDPNYIDPAKKMRSVGNNELGKDAFMTLLLTQMKNQDPTNPLKSHEMAAQLAQFTSLEKLHNINEGIENLHKDNQPNQNFQALSFIGKTISIDNSKIGRNDATSQHDIRFNLASDAQKLTMQIKDDKGAVIRSLEFKNLKSGKNELNWNGQLEDGSMAPVGDYTVAIEGFSSNGRKIAAETKSEGVITGVNLTPRGPQLLLGKQVINMSDVKSISDASLEQKPQQLATPPQAAMAMPGGAPGVASANVGAPPGMKIPPELMAQLQQKGMTMGAPPSQAAGQAAPTAAGAPLSGGPKKVEMKAETKPNAQKAAKMRKGDLNDAAMAQGLINKLNKEGAKSGMEGGV